MVWVEEQKLWYTYKKRKMVKKTHIEERQCEETGAQEKAVTHEPTTEA